MMSNIKVVIAGLIAFGARGPADYLRVGVSAVHAERNSSADLKRSERAHDQRFASTVSLTLLEIRPKASPLRRRGVAIEKSQSLILEWKVYLSVAAKI